MSCTATCRKPTRAGAHCGVCHKTFSAVTWFDIHRIGGRCNDIPGLVEKNGLWATKERHAQLEQQVTQLARMRGEELL